MNEGTEKVDSKPKTIERVLLGHRVAAYLSRFNFYYPNKELEENDDSSETKEKASLDMAWDYFQRITLPRRFVTAKGDTDFTKAEPGETQETVLYSPLNTPEDQLGDFGIGIGVYFASLRILAIVCFLAGLFYIPTLRYYGSDEYSPSSADGNNKDNRWSAMCSDTKWVACPACTDMSLFYPERIGNVTLHDGTFLTFVEKNLCEATDTSQGVNHIAVVFFLVISILLIGFYQSRLELKFDEDNLTASDYSIKIMNPPKDAIDPDEWREYFSCIEGAIPVYITVAIDNEKLKKALSNRRSLMVKLASYLPSTVDFAEREDFEAKIEAHMKLNDEQPSAWKQLFVKCGLCSTFESIYNDFVKVTKESEELMKQKYNVASVFVSFEYEAGQRRVLDALSIGVRDIKKNNMNALKKPEYIFRGKHVLHIREAYEPTTVRWNDQDQTPIRKLKEQLVTYSITTIVLLLDIWLISKAFERNLKIGALLVSVLNFVVPNFFIALNTFESHTNTGSYQASLYIKLCAFRWVNTAVALLVSYDFTQTLHANGGLLQAVRAIYIADMITVPVLQLLDLGSNFQRHVLGPRQMNQSSMNLLFRGTELNIAERYANMTKIIFISLFYAVVYPFGFVFSGACLTIQYFVDKFSLMRSWAPQSDIGNEIAILSRRYFLPGALVIIITMQTYFWTHFPFDNLCESDPIEQIASKYVGNHTVSTPDFRGVASVTKSFVIHESDLVYKPCYQFILAYPFEGKKAVYPPVPLDESSEADKFEWMNESQSFFSRIYGMSSIAVFLLVIFYSIYKGLIPYIKSYMFGTFGTDEIDSKQRYTDQPSIKAFVPMVKNSFFEHPLLACDVSRMNQRNIGWKDPIRDYNYYSLVHDAMRIKANMSSDEDKIETDEYIFSIIAYYGPSGGKSLEPENIGSEADEKSCDQSPASQQLSEDLGANKNACCGETPES